MRFLSLCSGIEAASVAWAPLGWKAAAFAEIEAFPSAVLAHHYSDVPNLGDITKFKEWPDLGTIDLICGGTPCQSFSVAGLRKGLADPRGNLALTFLAIVDRYRPRYVVWENVPGVLSSDGGRDFAAFLGGLGQLGYGWAYRVLDAQHVRVDGFPRAVPQRRRRVFVVGYLGDWRRAAAVLSEPESVLGNTPPRREAGQGPSEPTALSVAIRGRNGTPQAELGEDVANAILTPNGGRAGVGVGAVLANYVPDIVSQAMSSKWSKGSSGPAGDEIANLVAFDTTQVTSKANRSQPKAGDPCHPLATGAHPPAVAFTCSEQANSFAWERDVWQTLDAQIPNGSSNIQKGVRQGWAVRRLMPVECERLQGFPDGYTAIPYRGKSAADGPRYKALGNSWAVNVARWVGRRIEMVEQIAAEKRRSAA